MVLQYICTFKLVYLHSLFASSIITIYLYVYTAVVLTSPKHIIVYLQHAACTRGREIIPA